jgi:hypothetical protein
MKNTSKNLAFVAVLLVALMVLYFINTSANSNNESLIVQLSSEHITKISVSNDMSNYEQLVESGEAVTINQIIAVNQSTSKTSQHVIANKTGIFFKSNEQTGTVIGYIVQNNTPSKTLYFTVLEGDLHNILLGTNVILNNGDQWISGTLKIKLNPMKKNDNTLHKKIGIELKSSTSFTPHKRLTLKSS